MTEDIEDVDLAELLGRLDSDRLERLIVRLQNTNEGSTDLDLGVCLAFGGRKINSMWQNPLQVAWTGAPAPVSTSVDAALDLFKRFFPDTETRRHSLTLWSGRRPSARIFYQAADEQAEGGWAVGAINQWQLYGATDPIAILMATTKAIQDLLARFSLQHPISTRGEND